MPKIEVDEEALYRLVGRKIAPEDLERILTVAKAELDGREGSLLKIELNDTNRPDLWSTAGLARQLRLYLGGKHPEYGFFSRPGRAADPSGRRILVDPALAQIRPFIAGFAVTGKLLDDAGLADIIQTQEKLCWNYGRKRRSIAMGVYRSDGITYPVHFTAADPDSTRFVPLGLDPPRQLTLREILLEHPKGREFGPIVASFERFPYLADDRGATLSFPPVINSAGVGAVQVGDSELFIELTGTDIRTLLLATSIVACDLADQGWRVLPVAVSYPYETPFGKEIVTPFYFQEGLSVATSYASKLLGVPLEPREASELLGRMGCAASVAGSAVSITVPEYRNDFLHAVDIVEDIMMARGVESFEPVPPRDFTVGRISEIEALGRKVKDLMVGLGYQEMISNYLGSARDYLERMNVPERGAIRIANPMSESFEWIRPSVLPSMLASEAASAHATYPHAIFEVGKVAYLDERDVTGTRTADHLGLLVADKDAGFNTVRGHVAALLFYLSRDHTLAQVEDARFIRGRCAGLFVGGRRIGIIGEIHPQVLENWGIEMPCAAGEIDLTQLM